jgi:3-phenylpropionate/trans-cinnamate dioxygenase ferredoxin reductase subunit
VAGMHVNQWDTGIAPIQQLIRAGRPVDPARLANTSVPLADAVTHPPSPSASSAGIVR